MLVKAFKRAKHLSESGEHLFATPALQAFLQTGNHLLNIEENPLEFIEIFSELDDNDILSALKVWKDHSDPVLAMLSDGLLNRKLLGVEIQQKPFDEDKIEGLKKKMIKKLGWDQESAEYLVFTGTLSNSAYNEVDNEVKLWDNSGKLIDLSEASDIINPAILSHADNKYFLCCPKWLRGTGNN